MYKAPHPDKQRAAHALRNVLLATHATGRLALYVDMHAHANKRGAFFFGNAMPALDQVQNVMYAKLVALNSPYFDFVNSVFTETNMFAVGVNGEGKDSSSRVTLFQETGFVHSYTIECNYVTGLALNAVAGLPSIPGEEADTAGGAPCPKYVPAVFHDVGRGLMVALLDLQALNPVSRLPATSFRTVRGVSLWVQRALLVDAWEQHRRMQAIAQGTSLSSLSGHAAPPVAPRELPATVTSKLTASFPVVTTHGLSELAAVTETSAAAASIPVTVASAAGGGVAGRRRSAAAAAADAGSKASVSAQRRGTVSAATKPSGTTAAALRRQSAPR
jgi:hypothetical protein